MTVHDVVQRSPEWQALRLGRLCASRASDMLATIRSGEAASRRNLRVQLALERMTSRTQERNYQSQAMLDGIAREADALERYENVSGRLVQAVGFVAHELLMAGCSPDGVIGDFEGLVQAKCPIAATHLDYLKTGVVPGEYQSQILHELWITGARWCDFASFSPEFPDGLQLKIVHIRRVEKEIAEYEKKAVAFLAEVDRELEALQTLTNLDGVLRAAAEVA